MSGIYVFVQFLILSFSVITGPGILSAQSESDFFASIDWQFGPVLADLGGIASIRVPEGYVSANAKDCRRILEKMGNPSSGEEVGLFSPDDLF